MSGPTSAGPGRSILAPREFVRSFLHAVPASKLFAFGGDTRWPTSACAYAMQARRWLHRALQAEVDDGDLTEREAIALATRLMRGNQRHVSTSKAPTQQCGTGSLSRLTAHQN